MTPHSQMRMPVPTRDRNVSNIPMDWPSVNQNPYAGTSGSTFSYFEQ